MSDFKLFHFIINLKVIIKNGFVDCCCLFFIFHLFSRLFTWLTLFLLLFSLLQFFADGMVVVMMVVLSFAVDVCIVLLSSTLAQNVF